MYMLKKGRKQGVTLVELIVALAIFIILFIPIGNAVMQNIKANKSSEIKKEETMAINYGYEKLRDQADNIFLDIEDEEGKEYVLKKSSDKQEEDLAYQGKFNTYSYKYTIKDIDKSSTESGRTDPLQVSDKEFESKIVTISLKLYNQKSDDQIGSGEEYTFRVNR